MVNIDKVIEKGMNENKDCHNILLMGDFNFPHHDWTIDDYPSGESSDAFQTRILLDMTDKWFMSNVVRKPTRNCNILDLCFSNNDSLISSYEILCDNNLSDHNVIIFDTT